MNQKKIDKVPAKLDFIQSGTGLVLALFMWMHMFFVSTILLGKDVMYNVTRFFEGYYFFGESYPSIVSVAAGLATLAASSEPEASAATWSPRA